MLLWIVIAGLAAFFYRSFAEMAHEFHRPRTRFGILGVVIMIGFYAIIGLSTGIILARVSPESLRDVSILMIAEFAAVGAAGLFTYVIRTLIKRSWKKKSDDSQLIDQGR